MAANKVFSERKKKMTANQKPIDANKRVEAHQVKPEYTKIVAAIPHSVSEVHYWQWNGKPAMKEALNRWCKRRMCPV